MRIPLPADDVTANRKRRHTEKHSTPKGERESPESPMGDTEESFPHYKRVSDYLLGTCVGEGSFAKVRLAMHCPTKEKVAVKIINKAKARRDSYVFKNLHREGRILQMVRHPNVVQVFDILETGNNYYLVTELCAGGELIDIVTEQGHLPEETVRRYTSQLVNAVGYLHERKIIHRDLKVENLLLDSGGNIKIIDFGLSNTISTVCSDISCALSTQCGSPAYAAPELLSKKSYGPKVDVWSIGVITFALLVGKLPFTVEPFHIPKLCRKMMRGEMNPIPTNVTSQCRYFIRKLLSPDVIQRPNISEVAKLKWIFTFQPESSGKSMPKTSVSSLLIDRLVGDVRRRHSLMSPMVTSPIEASVVKEMSVSFGFACSDVIQCVQKNRPGPALATYHLLAKRREERNERKKETNRFAQALRTHIEVELNNENNRITNNHDNDVIEDPSSSGATTPSVERLPSPVATNEDRNEGRQTPKNKVSSPTYEIIRETSDKNHRKEESETVSPAPVEIRPKKSESVPFRSRNTNPRHESGKSEFMALLENMKIAREMERRSDERILGNAKMDAIPKDGRKSKTEPTSPQHLYVSPTLNRKLPLREQQKISSQFRTPRDSPINRGRFPTPPRSPSSRPASHASANTRTGNHAFNQRRSVFTPTQLNTAEWVNGGSAEVGTAIDTPPATPNRFLTVPTALPPIVQKVPETPKSPETKQKSRISLPVGGIARRLSSNRFSNTASTPNSPNLVLQNTKPKETQEQSDIKKMFVNKTRYGYYLTKRAEKTASLSPQRPKKTISEPIANAISYLTSKHNRAQNRELHGFQSR